MVKTAFIFPGQGAQYAGMGKALAQEFKCAREVFERADDALSLDISALCWNGPDSELRLTANAQPAIMTTSAACFEVLKGFGLVPDVVAGLSLGEYSALVCAGSIEFEDGVRLVRQRGLIMQEAVPDGVGAMAAIVGLDSRLVEQACREVAGHAGIVGPANYNCPGQIVISGEKAAVLEASQRAISLGAKKVIPLNVSGPFHSSLMKPAADRLADVLSSVPIRPALMPVVANVTAEQVDTPDCIREVLKKQMASPVLWEQSIRRILSEGATLFVEVGPGKTLAGFLRKIAQSVPCFSFDHRESLEAILESAGVGC